MQPYLIACEEPDYCDRIFKLGAGWEKCYQSAERTDAYCCNDVSFNVTDAGNLAACALYICYVFGNFI